MLTTSTQVLPLSGTEAPFGTHSTLIDLNTKVGDLDPIQKELGEGSPLSLTVHVQLIVVSVDFAVV